MIPLYTTLLSPLSLPEGRGFTRYILLPLPEASRHLQTAFEFQLHKGKHLRAVSWQRYKHGVADKEMKGGEVAGTYKDMYNNYLFKINYRR